MIFQSGLDYLIKIGAFITLYIALYLANHFIFDERLFHIIPMSIYLATKVSIQKDLSYLLLLDLYIKVLELNNVTNLCKEK